MAWGLIIQGVHFSWKIWALLTVDVDAPPRGKTSLP